MQSSGIKKGGRHNYGGPKSAVEAILVVPRYHRGFTLYRELYMRLQSYLPELSQLDS